MVRKSLSTRYPLLKVSIFSFIILYSSTSYVTGQPVLTTALANCGDDVTLTCSQPGFDITAGRLWKKGLVTISDTGKDSSGTDRYSEKSTSNDFSLVISNAMLADVDNYTCEYEFVSSNAEPLSFECKPTEWGVDVTRNNQKRLYIQINNIYPILTTIEVECALQDQSSVAIKGKPGTTTKNGDHFDVSWTSDDTISAGTYACTITVVTRTSTEIVKNGLTFSDPSLDGDKSGLQIGLAVGVSAGAIIVLCIIIIIILCCRKKDAQQKFEEVQNSLNDSQNEHAVLKKLVAETKKEVAKLKAENNQQAKLRSSSKYWTTGKPSTTSSLGLIHIKGKNLEVKWDPPDFSYQSEIEKYYIWKKEALSADWEVYRTANTGEKSIEVNDLEKQCDFMISAANKNGIGDILDTVTEAENDGTPGKPTELEFISKPDGLGVQWRRPNNCEVSSLKKYQILIVECDPSFSGLQDDKNKAEYIQSRIRANGNYVQAFVPRNATSYLVKTTLSSSTEGFICSVCAYNDEGCGKSSYCSRVSA